MMTWHDLKLLIDEIETAKPDFMIEAVQVYDSDLGEYYFADVIEFDERDEIIPENKIFLTFERGHENG